MSESVTAAGQRGNSNSSQPEISDDGAYVAFLSAATDLVPGGSGPANWNVYVWERSSGALSLVSESASVAGLRGDNTSTDALISNDGAFVAFSSHATDLVSGGSGFSGYANVYLWERSSHALTLVSESVSATGQSGDSDSTFPVISGDGTHVAFLSYATDLVSGASGPLTQNVYLWERLSGTTTLISPSISVAEQRADSDTYHLDIGGDGAHVTFRSEASDLIQRDFNGNSDVFLWSSGAPADTTPPSDPSWLSSAWPHVEGGWSNWVGVIMEWSGATEEVGGSGLAGYSIEWDHNAVSTPDAVVDVVHGTDPHSFFSEPLADGADWYFHLRTCDLAGNCSATLHRGPYGIDSTPPAGITGLHSPSHSSGSSNQPLQLVWDPVADTGSPISYLVVLSQFGMPGCFPGGGEVWGDLLQRGSLVLTVGGNLVRRRLCD